MERPKYHETVIAGAFRARKVEKLYRDEVVYSELLCATLLKEPLGAPVNSNCIRVVGGEGCTVEDFVEQKFEEVESSNHTADDLEDEISVIHDGRTERLLGGDIMTDGRLQVQRSTRPKGQAPQDAEEFRLVHKLLGHVWLFVKN